MTHFLRQTIVGLALTACFGCPASPPEPAQDGTAGLSTSDSTGSPSAEDFGRNADSGDLDQTSAVGEPDPLDGGNEEGGANETGTVGTCCYAGCNDACLSPPCEPQIIGAGMWDALNVLVVDAQWIVWSSGSDRTLEISTLEPGTQQQLTFIKANESTNQIAADDTHVYVLDSAGGLVHRVSVLDGQLQRVTAVERGIAGSGGLAVGDNDVFFAMGQSGGLWAAAKDLSDTQARLIANSPAPSDVAIDQTHVYWADTQTREIRRIALEGIGKGAKSSVVVDDVAVITFALDDTSIFFADYDTVIRAAKAGTNQEISVLANDQDSIGDLAVDELDVYWVSSSGNRVTRARKDGENDIVVLGEPTEPAGIALSCNAVYWSSSENATVYRQSK